jgi:hypothetical protein
MDMDMDIRIATPTRFSKKRCLKSVLLKPLTGALLFRYIPKAYNIFFLALPQAVTGKVPRVRRAATRRARRDPPWLGRAEAISPISDP